MFQSAMLKISCSVKEGQTFIINSEGQILVSSCVIVPAHHLHHLRKTNGYFPSEHYNASSFILMNTQSDW